MLFSSPVFLFLFLPLTLAGYFLLRRKTRNYWLLLASLVFFAWGSVSYTFILVVSIVLNYVFGLVIQKHHQSRAAYGWMLAGVSANLLILCVFKYANFIVLNINGLLGFLALPEVPQTHIILPIGISFYTFHSISYLIDTYRQKTPAQRNILDLSLYICMFSQLIAGPIIRYSDVWKQLRERTHSLLKFSGGVERFLIGLGKKVLLANVFAKVADDIFASNMADLSAANAWLGVVCYALQIYCDFSGYSDMAIGLGRMFGFEFMENFNFPYLSRSIREFWRRWHISLSTFFRDYVYIPLGGDRVSMSRTYFNLLLVFFLTGFWHGASWTFIVWGMLHGFFIVTEKLWLSKALERTWKPVANLYTLLALIFTWVLFRADSFSNAIWYWEAMLDFSLNASQANLLLQHLDRELYIALAIAIPGVFGLYGSAGAAIHKFMLSVNKSGVFTYSYHVCSALFYGAVLVICSVYLVAGTYNPFIYYRF